MNSVHVVTFPEEVWTGDEMLVVYCAQCLEHDICTQGDSVEDALDSFHQVLFGYGILNREFGRDLMDDLKPAPDLFRARYRTATPSNRHEIDLAPFLNVTTHG